MGQKKKNKKKNKNKSSPKSTPQESSGPVYDNSGLLATQTEPTIVLGDDTTDVTIEMDTAILTEWDNDFEKLKEDILSDRSRGVAGSRNAEIKKMLNDLKKRANEMKNNQLADDLQADLRIKKIARVAEIEKRQGTTSSYEKPQQGTKPKEVIDDNKISTADVKHIVDEQDEYISRISQDVTSLKSTGTAIKSELEMQTALLDGMDQDMDAVRGNLENETSHAKRVNANSSLCSLYMAILILFVVMVLLLVIGLR